MTSLSRSSYQCDVSDREQVDAVSKQILSEIGDVTLLFNNAGVRVVRPFLQHSTQQIEKTMNVNVLGMEVQ